MTKSIVITGCVFAALVSTGLFFTFLFIPNQHPPVGLVEEFSLNEQNSQHLRHNIRTTNVSGHPDRIALWLPHSIDGSVNSPETTCCQYIENGAHWVVRDDPYRIYQAPTRQFVTNAIDAGTHWEAKSGGYRIMGSAVESGRIFNDAELILIDINEVNFIARADLNYLGNGNVLGLTRLVMDRSLKHIFQWGIVINSNATTICDALENEECYDEKALFVHEIGHVYGLDDLYNSQCSSVVMYGYLAKGETRGRQIDLTTRSCVQGLYQNLPLEGESSNSSNRTSVFWSVMLHLLFELLV
jgi:predicted Zn-dependent protease